MTATRSASTGRFPISHVLLLVAAGLLVLSWGFGVVIFAAVLNDFVAARLPDVPDASTVTEQIALQALRLCVMAGMLSGVLVCRDVSRWLRRKAVERRPAWRTGRAAQSLRVCSFLAVAPIAALYWVAFATFGHVAAAAALDWLRRS